MKIALVTTDIELEENKRIEEEIRSLSHEFSLVNLKEFEYEILENRIFVRQFENLSPDLVIVRGVFRSIKSITAYLESLRRIGVKIFDNQFLLHKYSINKISDIIKLVQAGIPVPDTFHLHSFEKYLPSAAKVGYPIVCKLTRTGKGAGVHKFDGEEDFKRFIENIALNEGDPRNYIIQKFIPYVYDLRILVIGEDIFCMRRIPKEGEFRANFSLGGSVELFDLDEEGKKMALDAIRAVSISVAGVDMLIDPEGRRYILEVNHTPGMIGMEEATGENITRKYVEYAIANAV